MRKKIIDEFTNLPVSHQRKWQLRHPEKQREIKRRFEKSLKYRIRKREWMRKKLGCKKRRFGSKSYLEEERKNEN